MPGQKTFDGVSWWIRQDRCNPQGRVRVAPLAGDYAASPSPPLAKKCQAEAADRKCPPRTRPTHPGVRREPEDKQAFAAPVHLPAASGMAGAVAAAEGGNTPRGSFHAFAATKTSLPTSFHWASMQR